MLPLALGRAIGRTRFLPFGVRDRLLRLLWPPYGQVKYPFDMSFEGGRFAGDLDNYIDWHIYFFGRYEHNMLDIIAEILRHGSHCFWDVGANCGQHSVFAALHGAQVHSFEPWPPVLSKLAKNAAINPQLPITVHGFGLSDVTDDLPFVPPSDANFAGGSFGGVSDYRLPVKRGDDLTIQRPSLLKIDVQGFEANVLRGLQKTLVAARPTVICEDTALAAQMGLPDPALLLPNDYVRLQIVGGPERPTLALKGKQRVDCDAIFVPREKLATLGRFAQRYFTFAPS